MSYILTMVLTLAAFLLPSNAKADEAWAEYDNDTQTLTFKYGTEKTSGTETLFVYALNEAKAWNAKTIKKVVFDPSFASARPTSCYYWFIDQANLDSIEGMEYFCTDSVTTMERMFFRCNKLKTIDLTHFNTENVTNMRAMFNGCRALTELNVAHFDTKNVEFMETMFYGCTALTTIYASNTFVTTALTDNGRDMFGESPQLVGASNYSEDKIDASMANYNDGYFTEKQRTVWAQFDSSTGTFTFMYRPDRPSDGGTVTAYDLNEGASKPAWYGNVSMKKVVFDASFDAIRPTTCYYWFSGQKELEKIEGIEYLHTDSVTNMERMFYGCDALTELDLSRFNTDSVTSMEEMFRACDVLETVKFPTTTFSTASGCTLEDMFRNCDALKSLDLSNFNTENVTSMYRMFYDCDALESVTFPATTFSTASGCTLEQMFYCCTALKSLDLSNFNTENVTSMEEMFYGCTALESVKFPTAFSTASECTTEEMFAGCTALKTLDLSGFNAENVTDIEEMFRGCEALESVTFSSTINTASVTDFGGMFKDCEALTTLDLSGFNMGSATDLSEMFSNCEALQTIKFPTVFRTSSDGCSMSEMFNECKALKTLDLSGFNTAGVTEMNGMFNGCEVLESINFPSTFSTAEVWAMDNMFSECKSLKTLDLSGFNTENVGMMGEFFVGSMKEMFAGCEALESITFSSAFNTANVTDMYCMFYGCKALKTLDLSGFNTANVTNMVGMFYDCSALTSLDVSGFKTANVTGMYGMFYGCSGLTSLDVSGFNTANVTSMTGMFGGCSGLTSLDVSGFNTANVASMGDMFYGCSGLTSLDVSNFSTGHVEYMNNMFYGCSGLTSLDVSGFKTSKVENMNSMFSGCSGLTSLDVSGFNTANVTDVDSMFCGCSQLVTIYANDKFVATNVEKSAYMFTGCTSLEGNVKFDSSKTDINMANCTDGYFTYKKAPAQPWAEYDSNTMTLTFKYGDKPSTFDEGITAYDLNEGITVPEWYYDHNADITKVVFDASFNDARPTSCAAWFILMQNLAQIDGTQYLHTDKVRSMRCTFYGCTSLSSLDLSSFNTEKVTDMNAMFYGCNALTTIYVSNEFVTTGIDNSAGATYLFGGCTVLKGAVDYDANSTDATMANYNTGYFKSYYKIGDTKHDLYGETLSVDNLELEDGKDFVTYAPFTASTASYSRAMTSNWETLCLPFAVETTCTVDSTFYEIKSVNNDVITVSLLDGTIAAGTPVLVYSTNGLNISASNVDVVRKPAEGAQVNGYQLVGSFAETEVPDDGYIISNNKFCLTSDLKNNASEEAVKTKGLGAWLKSESGSSEAKPHVLSFAFDDKASGIDAINGLIEGTAEIYDIQGRRTDRLQRGVNIVKMGNVTKKVMVK